uniref:Uncharacterized protein n=1 Tax=Anguilla anguilla TaxID=7936 RepID=A0A0E9WS53_ANGAN
MQVWYVINLLLLRGSYVSPRRMVQTYSCGILTQNYTKKLHNYVRYQIFQYLACPAFALVTASILFGRLALSVFKKKFL